MSVVLHDEFWAPRVRQLTERTLPVIRERLEEQGVVDNFRRLAGGVEAPRRAMHFSDSDLYKWVEACALASAVDQCADVVELITEVQQPDGYVGTFYGFDGRRPRFSDLSFGHEHYCIGHLIEAAIAHHEATGSDAFLAVAMGAADHLLANFGPGRDARTDAHPEIELALCRLARVTGNERYVAHAAWIIETQLAAVGTDVDGFRLGGHAVRSLYLASGIAEVALATGDSRWTAAAVRAFEAMVALHAYPTGAVGGRWLGEAVGRPYELPDASAYAESCAAVAATQLAWRIWQLTGSPRALDQIELLLFNAVPCGVGADGASWFYSQPHAVDAVTEDFNPWVYGFDYGQQMQREWFPVRRHAWFDVPCCPPNLARQFAMVPHLVAETRGNDLLVHIPLAARITIGGWDVEISGSYPDRGELSVVVHAAVGGGGVRIRRPGWAGGDGHEPLASDGRYSIPIDDVWWTNTHRVEGGETVHLRRGPVVYCVEGVDVPGVDLRDLAVDPAAPIASAFTVCKSPTDSLYRPFDAKSPIARSRVDVVPVPYANWANREPTTMRMRFPTA